jgi:hypothetical protein
MHHFSCFHYQINRRKRKMSRRLFTHLLPRVLIVLALACPLAACLAASAADAWPSTGVHAGPAYARIRDALGQETRVEFIDTPLDTIVDFLTDQHDIPLGLDLAAMDQAGIPADTAITGNLRGVSLGSALQILLNPLGMTYTIENEILMLTTRDAATLRPEVRVYHVAKLLGDEGDAAQLAGTIYQALSPVGVPGAPGAGGYGGGGFFDVQDQPGLGGGGGMAVPPPQPNAGLRIIPYKQLLIVRHTTIGQHQVASLLAALAAAQQEKAGSPRSSSENPFD